jgi:glycosyltransferase involved in cell wall biosynthesis
MGIGKEPPALVLHLISRLGVGGVENQLFQVTRRYDRSLLSPMVCSIRGKGEIGREIEEAGTEVIALGRRKVHQFDPMLVLQISRLLRQRGVRILRTHQYEAGLYGRLAALLAGTPVIVSSFHNIYRRRKWHRERINHILARCTDRIIAVSECVKSDIIRYDAIADEKVQVIYNGIDPAQFQGEVRIEEVKAALGIPPHSRIVGTIGRMTPQKDHATLLEAFANLPKNWDLRLLIVGDGPLRGSLQKRAEELGIGNDVHLVGFRRDVYPVLRIMEVFVLPSLWEGMGTAIVEAMAAERPVVASDLPPIREIIPSSTLGILVRPKDEDSLRRGIGQILEDRGLAGDMGKRAREYALSRFPIQRAVRQYQDLFAEIEDGKFRPNRRP